MRVTHLLRERISVAKFLRVGSDGEPVYSDREDNIPARVVSTVAVVLSGKDEAASTVSTIATDLDMPIGPQDRVWLPGRTIPLTPVNGGSAPGKDVRGNICHWETTL